MNIFSLRPGWKLPCRTDLGTGTAANAGFHKQFRKEVHHFFFVIPMGYNSLLFQLSRGIYTNESKREECKIGRRQAMSTEDPVCGILVVKGKTTARTGGGFDDKVKKMHKIRTISARILQKVCERNSIDAVLFRPALETKSQPNEVGAIWKRKTTPSGKEASPQGGDLCHKGLFKAVISEHFRCPYSQVCTQNKITTQRSGCDFERRSSGMSAL